MKSNNGDTDPGLDRGLGLKEATALNMIDMVGIGPFVILPAVLGFIPGPHCIAAWLSGALLAIIDGFIWAELGAAMPQAGGSYVFLRESYGPGRFGRLLSFLFIWQTIFQAPLVIASGAIGFSGYAKYLLPGLDNVGTFSILGWELTEQRLVLKIISALLVTLLVVLLYRRIRTIGKISLVLWVLVIGTILWLIFAGATNFDAGLAFSYPEGAWDMTWPFWVALGQATVQTIYTYLGYYNVNHLGGEIIAPQRNIPRAIFISIGGITVLYIGMQLSVLGVLPWQEAMKSEFVFSTFFERVYGGWAGTTATIMILVIAFSSLYSALLGYSRIPYAAAKDGTFFAFFSHVHPTKHFPNFSLLMLGGLALVFSVAFDSVREVVKAILAMRILVQFVGGAIGLMLLRRKWSPDRFPYKMPLYPVPVILAVIIWLGLFVATGPDYMTGGTIVLAIGLVAFLIRAKITREWPFGEPKVTAE